MLVSDHRSGGLATASRAGLRRSGVTERITRLYSKFDAALRGARLYVHAIYAHAMARLAADARPSPNLTEAGDAGLAIACTSSRHHIPGAQ
jgi:hypothetical protein